MSVCIFKNGFSLPSYICCYLLNQFTGTPTRPRLSVFCSDKQLYAMLVDDQNQKCLFYGSTLQKSIRDKPPRTTIVSPKVRFFGYLIDKSWEERASYSTSIECGTYLTPIRKRLNVLVKSLSRFVLTWTLMRYQPMIGMVLLVGRGSKPLK